MKNQSKSRKQQKSRVTARRRTKKPASARSVAAASGPFRLKQILVTTDFSDESKKALPYAAAFAKRLGGKIALLNVVESQSHFTGLESVVLFQSGDAAMAEVYEGLDQIAKRSFGGKDQIATHARTGKPFREIIKAASELDADLLIMSSHGYTGLKHTLIGSTTERVVQHAPCPVLAVRGGTDEASGSRQKRVTIRRILLATDFSDNSLKAFPLAQSLADAFGARLTLIHVVERFPIDAILGEELTHQTSAQLIELARARLTGLVADLRKRGGFRAEVVVRFGKPFDEIARYAKEMDASLIVASTHGYTGLKHLYLGSVAERVLRHAPCPVLVVRETKA